MFISVYVTSEHIKANKAKNRVLAQELDFWWYLSPRLTSLHSSLICGSSASATWKSSWYHHLAHIFLSCVQEYCGSLCWSFSILVIQPQEKMKSVCLGLSLGKSCWLYASYLHFVILEVCRRLLLGFTWRSLMTASFACFPSRRTVIKLERARCRRKWKAKTDTESIRGLGLVGLLKGPGQRSISEGTMGLPRGWKLLEIHKKYR